jgi:hypothetical protein
MERLTLPNEGEIVRKLVLVLGAAVASLSLSACGAGTKATINQSVASLGAQPNLQIHFTASVSGAGTSQAQQVLNDLSYDIKYSNPSGGPISQSTGKSNIDVSFNVGSTSLLELRGIGSNVYLILDLSPISSIPGLNLTTQDQSELAAAQLLLGGKWFEIPASLIKSELPSSDASKANAAQESALAKKVIDALSKLIDKGHAKALSSGGYSETGTLESVLKAVAPTIASLDPSASTAGPVKGTYTLTLKGSGGVANGASITITAPSGKGNGNASVGLSASVTHDNDPIVAPTNATVITPALIKQLLGASGLAA